MSRKELFILGALLVLALFLRFYKLGQNPPAIYWDETAIGIDAYCLSQTGRDQYGQSWFQAIFPSYGDYKAPVYIWLASLSVKAFGLNEFSVRFPSAFFGSLTVLVVYFLVKELFSPLNSLTPGLRNSPANRRGKGNPGVFSLAGLRLTRSVISQPLLERNRLALVASLLLAISPWHLQFSRIGFESNLSLFWLVLFGWLFLRGLRKGFYFILASLVGSLAVYSYFSTRVVLPAMAFLFFFIYHRKCWQKKGWLLISILFFSFSLRPLFRSPLYPLSQQLRMSTPNALTDESLVKHSIRLIEEDGLVWWSRFLHHRWIYIGRQFLTNYLSHFSPHFLFLQGDKNLRHHTGFGGELYLLLLPILLIGLYQLLRKFNQLSAFLLVWLLTAPLAAAVPYQVPHASRAIYMIIPLVIICAVGLVVFFNFIRSSVCRKLPTSYFLLPTSYFLFLILNINVYLHDYFKHYPFRSAFYWQDGYQRLIRYLREEQGNYEKIYITQDYRLPSLYGLFYLQPSAEKIQTQQGSRLENNPTNFGELNQLDNFVFGLKNWGESQEKALYVFPPFIPASL